MWRNFWWYSSKKGITEMENSIREDIKILENLKTAIDTGCVNFGGKSMYGCGYQEAIEHILSDYKRVLKENEEQKACIHILDNELKEINEKRKKQEIKIQELQKENEKLKEVRKWYFENTINKICSPEMLNKILRDDYISKKEVKDKIEKERKHHEKNILDIENITMLRSKTAKEEAEIEFNKYAIVVLNKMLQELIEESEEN